MLTPTPPQQNKQSLLILGMKQKQEELLLLNTTTASSVNTGNNKHYHHHHQKRERTLSFGWTEQLSQVYGSSCEAVFDVLSSIDAAVRGNFSSAVEHYTSVCVSLEIKHTPEKNKPANRQIYNCCVAHDQLHEAVLKWSDARAAENNVPKVTKVAPKEEEKEKENEKESETALVAFTAFDKLSWECETVANTSLTHHDTKTNHHPSAVEHHDHRHLNEKIQLSRRALLEVALSCEDNAEDTLEIRRLWNDATLNTLNLKNSALGERGFVALLATLQMLPHVSSLKIPDCFLISPFIVALAVVCRPRFLPRLRHLDLDGNPGGSMSVEALCELVRAHPLLTEVVIDRGFECLPSTRKRLQKAVDENKKRNALRREKCKQKLEKEELEEKQRRENQENERLLLLNKNLTVLSDIESRSRTNVEKLESSEFIEDIQTSFDREKLSLEMYLNQREESEQQRLELEKKEKMWKESQEAERSSIETRENGRRRGIESDYDSLMTALARDEEIRRTSIVRNVEARAQLGIELEKDAKKRQELSQKLEASREEYKKAFDERLDVDRHLALVKKQYLEKVTIDTINSDEPASRRALEKTEISTREFLISSFSREKLDRERRQDERDEVERVAAENLMKRSIAQAHESAIRQRDDEVSQRREEEAMRESLRKVQEEEKEQEQQREKEEAEKRAREEEKAKEQEAAAARIAQEEKEQQQQEQQRAEEEEQRRVGIRKFFSEKPQVEPRHLMMSSEKKEYRELFELMTDFREKEGMTKDEFLKSLDTEWPGHRLTNKACVEKSFDFAAKDSSGGIKDVDELILVFQYCAYANNLLPLFEDVSKEGVGTISKQEFTACSGSFAITTPDTEWQSMLEYINNKLETQMDPPTEVISYDLFVFWLSREKPYFDVEVEEAEDEEQEQSSGEQKQQQDQEQTQEQDQEQTEDKKEEENPTVHEKQEPREQQQDLESIEKALTELPVDEEIQRTEIDQLEAQKHGGIRLLFKLEDASHQEKWKKQQEEDQAARSEKSQDQAAADEQKQVEAEENDNDDEIKKREAEQKEQALLAIQQFMSQEETSRQDCSTQEETERNDLEVSLKVSIEQQLVLEEENRKKKQAREQEEKLRLEQEEAEKKKKAEEEEEKEKEKAKLLQAEKEKEEQARKAAAAQEEQHHSPAPAQPQQPTDQEGNETMDKPQNTNNKSPSSKSKSSSSEVHPPDADEPAPSLQQLNHDDDDHDHDESAAQQNQVETAVAVAPTKTEEEVVVNNANNNNNITSVQKNEVDEVDELSTPKPEREKSKSKSKSRSKSTSEEGFEDSTSSLDSDAIRGASTSSDDDVDEL